MIDECPDESTLLDFAAGAPLAQRDKLEAHFATCDRCRIAVAQLVTVAPSVRAARLEAGTRVGRYVLIGLVGEGAMGRVYAAFDPVLDRKIALKLLHPFGDSPVARDRMRREAQALARVSHPNLVVVHDAGDIDGSIFIAMEFVEGTTLRQWRTDKAPSAAEIVSAYVQAARGLEAVHHAGLVHRDFKPENALMSPDGRVRVTDFGLARALSPDFRPADEPLPGEDLASRITSPGLPEGVSGIAGTPAYMAPEQLDRLGSGPKADQFSFCCALAEALSGKRPFHENIIETVNEGPMLPGVSGQVARVLRRGLQGDPARRFASMAQLAAALEPSKVTWRAAAISAAVVLTSASAVAYVSTTSARLCRGGTERVNAVLTPARREALNATFIGLGGQGPAQFAQIISQLDATLAQWSTMHQENCEASQVRREQSAAMFEARAACLNRRLVEVDAVLEVLATTTADSSSRAVDAVSSLTPIQVCGWAAALSATPSDAPQDHRLRMRMAALELSIANASALWAAGRYTESFEASAAAATEARALGWPSREAAALLIEGRTRAGSGESDAQVYLRQAWAKALTSGDDRVAVMAAVSLGRNLADHAELKAAKEWLWQANAVLARLKGARDLEALVAQHEGHLLVNENEFAKARLRYQAAYDAWSDMGERRQMARLLYDLGNAFSGEHQFAEAIESHRRAIELVSATMALGHPFMATMHIGLAENLINLHREAEAAEAIDRVLPAQLEALDEGDLHLAQLREIKAAAIRGLGRGDEALQLVTAAQRTFEAKGLARNVVWSLVSRATILGSLRRWPEAMAAVRQARALATEKFGAADLDVTVAWQTEGELRFEAGELDLAVAAMGKALEGHRARHDDAMVGYCLSWLGRIHQAMGRHGQAHDELRRAVESLESSGLDAELLALTKAALRADTH